MSTRLMEKKEFPGLINDPRSLENEKRQSLMLDVRKTTPFGPPFPILNEKKKVGKVSLLFISDIGAILIRSDTCYFHP
jgi:hypothetical protein